MFRKPAASVRPLVLALVVASSAWAVSACAPIVLGSAYVGTMAATDRRTVGIQVEDKNIELKASSRLSGRYGDKGHINVNAYNRKLLLTGEVPDEAAKRDAEEQARGVENVRAIVNELQIGIPTSLATRSNDLFIEGKIKASLVDAKDLFANSFRITVENGVAYLMGRVTEREGKRGAEIAAGVSGVKKVVKVFDYITEEELQDLSKVKAEQDQSQTAGGSSDSR
ncbi:BON domain-containing protein [Pigmentiphaga sp.]|uniref:BON domain-containing protein n=1 Tax=Pigmentiphaga sp. TaxID=1977564 RepID=UPI00128BB065|nr:BON domain-containing protein [Pigmentiphaga sp.]MPS27226.1 BON domain-containing protein [Alcaligenaceae bacterium SAGV5]MPS51630.1 BON domain-containing protein [Alcaligenaceae bacterium SAGV3]MPT55504.1 BON domain-containing protein [Alcaligenaceae bacterium]